MADTPLGYVMWRTSQNMYVVCPFCELIHHHRYRNDDFKGRGSDCPLGGSGYRVVFPFETGSEAFHLHFEIDKRRKRYNTVGIDLRDEWEIDEDTQHVERLIDQLQSLEFKRSTENHTQTSAADKVLEEEFKWLISFCVNNDVLEPQHFLRTAKSSLQQCLETLILPVKASASVKHSPQVVHLCGILPIDILNSR